ncbi:MAG: hypothetical protein H0T79_08100 [Deltaproteobacteria bacterium]|nr:hypothetical protein [Deltaproteobacteria bacterium]
MGKHTGVVVVMVLAGAGCLAPGDEVSSTEAWVAAAKGDKCAKKPGKKKCVVTTAVVGVEGTTLATADGLTMEIPFGALAAPTTITVTTTTLDAPPELGGVSPVYSFEPEGLVFARPIAITLPLPAGVTAASMYWTRLGSLSFDPIGGTITGSTIHGRDGALQPRRHRRLERGANGLGRRHHHLDLGDDTHLRADGLHRAPGLRDPW